MRRVTLALLAAALAAAIGAPAAAAHAILLATEPANDTVVETSPAQVRLRFDEPIETAFGSVRVSAGEASRVDVGPTLRPQPNEAAVQLKPNLAKGTYSVGWRVVSADGHPVHRAFVFHVGLPGANPSGLGLGVV